MLKIKNITKYYNEIPGIKNLTITINKGEIFGFIGPNGAGKSTTIRSILNFLKISKGSITIDKNNHTDINTKNKIGYLPGEIKLYDDLTVIKILKYNNKFYQEDYLDYALELCKYLELDTSRKIENLSLGNLKKVGIVLALMHKPELLILDEPTSGLDPLIQNKFFELLQNEKDKGTTIFFSSHILSEVKQICDRVAIIKDNELVKVMDIKELKQTHNYNIEIISKDIDKLAKELKIEIKDNRFTYQQDINKLIKVLNNYKIERLIIQEEDIENIFMKYYEVENDK